MGAEFKSSGTTDTTPNTHLALCTKVCEKDKIQSASAVISGSEKMIDAVYLNPEKSICINNETTTFTNRDIEVHICLLGFLFRHISARQKKCF